MPTSIIKVSLKDAASAGLKGIGKQVENLEGKLTGLNNSFVANQKKLKALSKVGAGMKSVGVGLTAGLTAPLGFFGASIVRTSLDFEKAMNEVEAKALVSGKSLDDLKAQAKEMGASTKFSAVEAANAMVFMAQAGFDTEKIYNALPGVLSLAAAGNTEIARTADVASNIMGAFGIEANKMGKVADTLAMTMASSNVDLEMLAETMKLAAPVADDFGLSLEDTAAATGLLGNIGIQGSMAGTTLRQMFLGLSTITPKVKEGLSDLGVEITDQNGNLNSFSSIMSQVGKALPKLEQASQMKLLKDVFGQRAISGASKLAKQAGGAVNVVEIFSQKIDKAEGAAKKMAETMQQGATGSITRMKSAFEGLQLSLGESGLLGVVGEAAESLGKLFGDISKANPEMLKMGLVVGAAAFAFGPLLMMFGSFLTVMPALITMFTGLGLSFGAAAGAAVALPLAIAAIGVAGFMLIKNWKKISLFFSQIFDDMWESFNNFTDSLVMKIPGLGKFLGIEEAREKEREEKADRDLKRELELLELEKNTAEGVDLKSLIATIGGGALQKTVLEQSISETTQKNKLEIEVKAPQGGAKIKDTKLPKGTTVSLATGLVGSTL